MSETTTRANPAPRRRGDELNERQARFVAAYLSNKGNATQAAIAAGYSPRTAKNCGSRLLAHGDIARELARAQDSAADRIDASAERIILEIARLAFVDPARMFDEAGELLPIHRMPADVRRAVSSFDIEQRVDDQGRTITTRKIRTASKAEALRLLAQVRGLLVERHQLEGPAAVTVSIGIAPRPVTQPAIEVGSGSTEALGPKGSTAQARVRAEQSPP